MPGLFTFAGATGVPSTAATTGLANEIEINANVDPSQGGNVNLLRDGGISDTANPDYTYNATGDGELHRSHPAIDERADDRPELRRFDRIADVGEPDRLRQ